MGMSLMMAILVNLLRKGLCFNGTDPVGGPEPESEQGTASVAEGKSGGAGSGRRRARGTATPEG